MKKITLLLISVLLVALLCGCGQKADKKENSSSTQSEETVTVLSEDEAKETAKKLFENLDKIDYLGASAIQMDKNDTIKVEDRYTYALVTDENYKNLESIKTFVNTTLTEKAKNSKYSNLYEGEPAQYIEQDGKLYGLNGGRGCGYAVKGEITVSDITETSFKAEGKYETGGAEYLLKATVIFENNLWKIDEFTSEK